MSPNHDLRKGCSIQLFKARMLLVAMVLLLAILGGVFWLPRPPTTNHEALHSEWHNTSPSTIYIGSQPCAECHATIAQVYSGHAMGTSISRLAAEDGPNEVLAQFIIEDRAIFSVLREGGAQFHEVALTDSEGKKIEGLSSKKRVDFVIGSGRRGKSFLYDQEGHLFQSPISWYQQKDGWDLSPGYSLGQETGLFERPITPECLFCHAGGFNHRDWTHNQYEPPIFSEMAIGCERCHGPGEMHRDRHRQGTNTRVPDRSIVNPKYLEPRLRDNVCEQCHLRGEVRVARRGRLLTEYRPGLPLDEFLRIFVIKENADTSKQHSSVSHVEQMRESRCFAGSKGKMACTSCHDPHYLPAGSERTGYFRQRCLNCHQDSYVPHCADLGSKLALTDPQNDCASCHMPKHDLRGIPHVAETNHRVERRPVARVATSQETKPSSRKLTVYPDRERISDPDEMRDLGVAISQLCFTHDVQEYQVPALQISAAVVDKWPDDWESRLNLAELLKSIGQHQAALKEYEHVLEARPNQPRGLRDLASLYVELGQIDRGIPLAQRLAQAPPVTSNNLAILADAFIRRGQWKESRDTSSRALNLDPLNWRARLLLVESLVASGQKQEAEEQLSLFERARASDAGRVRRWVESIMEETSKDPR